MARSGHSGAVPANSSLTLNNDTSASNPARAKLNPLRYAWFYPTWPLSWTVLLAGSVFLAVGVSLWFLFLVAPILTLNIFYWIRVKEFFAHGDSNPGLVIHLRPTLVAVVTDLGNRGGVYPAIKVFRTRLRRIMGEKIEVGTRLATVALYSRGTDPKVPHWADFDPRPLECATGNPQVVHRVFDLYSPGEWRRLEACIGRLPANAPGLYRLREWPELGPEIADGLSLEQFWEIIEATKASEKQEQLDLLRAELERRPTIEVIAFQRRCTELRLAAYNWDLWLAAMVCGGWMCSDDSFTNFRNWLISQGPERYVSALRDPDGLIEVLGDTGEWEFELFGYVPAEVYRQRTGRELGDLPELSFHRQQEPSGGDWLRPELKDRTGSHMLNRCVVFREVGDPEFAAIEKRFPRLWRYITEKGLIKLRDPNAPLTPEEVARSRVDPNLEKTNFPAYLKALADAAREEYTRRGKKD